MEVLTIAKLDHQLNEEIRDKEIRLIGADGAQLGIMSSAQANAMAEEQGMDLVKISPNATPPVCKIMDYSKFCFDQKKREKEAKKNQRVVEIKEIRMSPSIDTNDFNTKVKAAQKFLSDGNRVKVSVRFRGREMAHTNLGEKLLMDFAASCSEIAGMEKNPKLEGLMASIVELGHKLDVCIVAEGIETQQQVDLLKRVGCDMIQGYFYSRPLPIAEFEAWLNERGEWEAEKPENNN